MTRYEWAMKEENKWRRIARNEKRDNQAQRAYDAATAIMLYRLEMKAEEATEIIPENDSDE